MSIEFTYFNPEDKTILWGGLAQDKDTLPPLPAGYEHYRVALGINGNPEKHKVQIDVVENEEKYSLIDYTPLRTHEELLQAIENERGRRLAKGFIYDFKDGRGKHEIGTSVADEAGWDKVTKLSQAHILSGNPDAKIQIVTNTGPVEVTAMEWQLILIQAGAFQQPIYAVSFGLQTLDPLPQDVENPEYWK